MIPATDKIIVRTEKKEETTVSGIVLPDSVDRQIPGKGKVEAVAENLKYVPVGSIIHFDHWKAHELEENLLVIDVKDVLVYESATSQKD